MTAEEKTILARFLDLAGDYLKDGYLHLNVDYSFKDDEPETRGEISKEKPDDRDEVPGTGKSGLPLAYLVDEPDESTDSGETIDSIIRDINTCTACSLAACRTLTVPGEGSLHPLVMIIGEGPGVEEDKTGRPFVGRAGQLLDRMLESIGLSRDKNCYIANLVKCRPPENHDPSTEEITACFHFLKRQITVLNPAIILCAGKVSAQSLLKTNMEINSLRGNFSDFTLDEADGTKIILIEGDSPELNRTIPLLCTFNPGEILRDESCKRPAWEDLKLLRSKIDSLMEK